MKSFHQVWLYVSGGPAEFRCVSIVSTVINRRSLSGKRRALAGASDAVSWRRCRNGRLWLIELVTEME
jgi:hypothetical protein